MAQDLDRNEPATPHKLQEARKRGQVAKSADVVSAVVFTAAVTYLYWHGWGSLYEVFRFGQSIFTFAARSNIDVAVAMQIVAYVVKGALAILAPFFATIVLAGILANLMQTGPVFSTYPLKPDLNRINPAKGLKKLFSLRTLFELLRSVLKLALLGFVSYLALKSLIPQFFNLAGLSPFGYVHTLLDNTASLGLKMALMLGFIALLDLLYMRRQFAKQMSMSKRELKEEVKQREGHPRIRSRLRSLRQEMRKRSAAVAKTKNADVLITNPTHMAVALSYKHGEMESPQVVAKGAGMLASAMRTIAARHNIPVVQNRSLARRLFHQVDFGQHVPVSLYADVARIIVWVFAMRRSQQEMRRTMRATEAQWS
jgi:flagellar biosynthetic protein FlhB